VTGRDFPVDADGRGAGRLEQNGLGGSLAAAYFQNFYFSGIKVDVGADQLSQVFVEAYLGVSILQVAVPVVPPESQGRQTALDQ
jgi:hypothetical protein